LSLAGHELLFELLQLRFEVVLLKVTFSRQTLSLLDTVVVLGVFAQEHLVLVPQLVQLCGLLLVFGKELPAVGKQVLANAESLFKVLLDHLNLRVHLAKLLHRVFVHETLREAFINKRLLNAILVLHQFLLEKVQICQKQRCLIKPGHSTREATW
jgi:hypothetical protein